MDNLLITTRDEYNQLLENVKAEYVKRNAEVSRLDGVREDILHYLELYPCNGATLLKLASRLQKVQRERRIAKNYAAEIEGVYKKLSATGMAKELKSDENKQWVVKSHILDDIHPERILKKHIT